MRAHPFGGAVAIPLLQRVEQEIVFGETAVIGRRQGLFAQLSPYCRPAHGEMGRSFGATRWQSFTRIVFWAALPEILAGIRMGLIRAVKGIIIGQLLVSVVALGRMFLTFSRNFQFEEFWALTFILFVFALGFSALVGRLEHAVEYYAGTRT